MLRKTLMWLPVLLLFAAPLAAQAPTPEGTKITNTATVKYTDAAGNLYENTAVSPEIVVDFKAGIMVVAGAEVDVMPGDTGSVKFTVTNQGNGHGGADGQGNDWFVVSQPVVSAGITVTGYTYNGGFYETLAGLNAQLLLDKVDPAGEIDVYVHYAVADGTTAKQTVELTVTSGRDNLVYDVDTADINIIAVSVTVTVDPTSVTRLPGATEYTATFTVKNTGDATATFDLTSADDSFVTANAPSVSQVTLAAGASTTVTVTYTVALGGGEASLTATLSTDGDISATATQTISTQEQLLEFTKKLYKNNVELLEADLVLPGDTLVYKITVKNVSSFAAATIVVADALPDALTYVSHDATGWTASDYNVTTEKTVTATLATLPPYSAGPPVTGEVVLVITVTVK
jgi:uncharacterized repeat protein (TIGR01451 family)